MFLKQNINSETKKLQDELLALGYDFNELLGGCHKPRENYLDIAEALAKHIDKNYHWHNLQKIIKAIAAIMFLNPQLIETSDQTDRRHKIVQTLISQFNKPNIGHNKFQVTENLQRDLDKFKNNIQELIQHACSFSLSRSIFLHIEADDSFLSTIFNFWETSKNPLTKKELFSCLVDFVQSEEIFLSKLNNNPENKSFVQSFLEHDDGFLSYGNIYYSEINNRKKLIDLIKHLDCYEKPKLETFAKEKIKILKQTDFHLTQLSGLFKEVSGGIFINPRVKRISPEYIHKKQWKFVAKTLIQNIDSDFYWTVKILISDLLGESWYSTNHKLRYEALEKLFEHLEADHDKTYKFKSYPELAEKPKDLDSRMNKSIAESISSLIKPANKTDKELYFEKLKNIVENDRYGYSRYYFLKPLARLGKDEVTNTLIKLMNGSDNALKQSALEEIRRLKPKEAKPHLEKFIMQFGKKYDFHKEIAQTALRGIIKKHF